MKKSLGIILLCILVLVGCRNQENVETVMNEELVENNTEKVQEKGSAETEEEQNNEEATNNEEEIEEEQTVITKYRLNPNNWAFEPIGEATPKAVLLTIDDAPDKYSLKMAETLKKLNAKAIFFVNGHFIDTPEEAATLKKIHEMGFAIGNHTMSHSMLKELTEQQQYDEIIKLNERIEEIIGEKPQFFRAPFGVNTDYSKELVANKEMLLMNWTYGYDWEKDYQSKEAIADIMVNTPYLNNGGNLLMHDREWTSEALEDIVLGLREKGYEIIDPATIETAITKIN